MVLGDIEPAPKEAVPALETAARGDLPAAKIAWPKARILPGSYEGLAIRRS